MTAQEINQIPFVFIVGMARSGTTLLRTIMDAGEEAVFAPEAKIIIHLKSKYNHCRTWTPKMIDSFTEDLFTDVKFEKTWNFNKTVFLQKAHSYPLSEVSFSFLIRLVYLSFPSHYEKSKVKVIGDKNPSYSILIEELLEIFPNAKFVHLVRDYRDCVLSNRKLFKRQNLAALTQTWKMYNEYIERFQKLYPHQFFRIRYEDLTVNPEKEIRDLCRFSGLEFQSKMLSFHEELKVKIDPEIKEVLEQTHPKLLSPISSDRVGVWEKEFTKDEINLITYIAGKSGEKYDYKIFPNYNNETFLGKKISSHFLNIRDFLVVKIYYVLPFSLRQKITRMNRFLFEKTGFFTVYNQGDLLFDRVKQLKENEK